MACDDERFIGSLVLSMRSRIDELIVVDDGSLDNTANIARYAGATVLQHSSHMGRIASVNTGFRHIQESGPATVLILDGGSESYPDDFTHLLEPIEQEQADIVRGIRSQGDNTMGTATSSPDTSDLRTTTYALSSQAVKRLVFDEHGASFEHQLVHNAAHEWLTRRHVGADETRGQETPTATSP